MEPDVIRMYSSSPPPMEDAAEEDDDNEFGDFDTFSGVPTSISFTEFDTPTTFNQTQALGATSPPELLLLNNGLGSANGRSARAPSGESPKANGVVALGCVAPERTAETKKALSSSSSSTSASSGSLGFSVSADATTDGTEDRNGEVLTNGFATSDVQGSPSSQNSVHRSSHTKEGASAEDTGSSGGIPGDDFADFAAFSDAEGHCNVARGTTSEDDVGDTNGTGPDESVSRDTDTDSRQRDVAFAARERLASEGALANGELAPNGTDEACRYGERELSSPDGKGSGNETETETSLGRPLSTDALEEFGDMSAATGSAPSPPLLHGETATPGDHSQLAEDDDEDDDEDEDFGDFGDPGALGAGQGFADFERSRPDSANAPEEDDFGDFNSPKLHAGCGDDGEGHGEFGEFPVSDSFGNFSSAAEGEPGAGWSAFGEQPAEDGESWAAFGTEPSVGVAAPPAESREEEEEEELKEELEEEEEEWHQSEHPAVSEETSTTDRQSASLSSRLERLFQGSFPPTAAPSVGTDVVPLRVLLGPPEEEEEEEEKPQPGGAQEEAETSPCNRSVRSSVWTQLQDIHEALGLRYQWGGSYCNKALLCCLGIDTRNILFTGQKKQPVIVPMYAASLGMLEPTKEPVKPVSAAEMIASIAQAPPVAPEKSSCPSDSVQEALPPVQFDWSSSGLTNPLDASGGSSLLNLDFFGPVEDSGSSSSPSIPGVDPELYELTTAKLEPGSSGSRVADAFARLMSTMEKTSTATRKPRKEENLSDEAAQVISRLPDLSFMQAKVLMFPAMLTPLSCQAVPDASPAPFS
ncbi:aftiphilin a isoform X2 [Perca flavescens]|uniref:aftiphilin a isoform X2 n=1 Tax=Perca flavescens TaxID=8167 RepID=UPI00106E11CD|nr:aftiphilin-like isoform X2 [Perca flavescens]